MDLATFTLESFNAASRDDARRLLLLCADVPSWADAVAENRPYPSMQALLARADAASEEWSDAEVAVALEQHPRIGERSTGTAAEAALSRQEQSGVGDDADLAARLRAANVAYEQRFGRVFLIRAAGRSGEEILAALEERLAADEATEWPQTVRELREIALLRLARAVGGEDL